MVQHRIPILKCSSALQPNQCYSRATPIDQLSSKFQLVDSSYSSLSISSHYFHSNPTTMSWRNIKNALTPKKGGKYSSWGSGNKKDNEWRKREEERMKQEKERMEWQRKQEEKSRKEELEEKRRKEQEMWERLRREAKEEEERKKREARERQQAQEERINKYCRDNGYYCGEAKIKDNKKKHHW